MKAIITIFIPLILAGCAVASPPNHSATPEEIESYIQEDLEWLKAHPEEDVFDLFREPKRDTRPIITLSPISP